MVDLVRRAPRRGFSPGCVVAEVGGVTSDLLRTVLASALLGFAAPVAGYHLPSLVPALRRIGRDRR